MSNYGAGNCNVGRTMQFITLTVYILNIVIRDIK